MPSEITFREFVEKVYKKPYEEISENEIKETYREIFCFGLAKDDLPDDWFGEISFKDMLGK